MALGERATGRVEPVRNREWLVHFPRVESQLCARLEPRLGRKLADAELVVLMQVSYGTGELVLLDQR